MDIDFPTNWVYNYNNVARDYCIAENTETGVCIGYTNKANSDSFTLWVGEHVRYYTKIKYSIPTKNKVKIEALQFMKENPEVNC